MISLSLEPSRRRILARRLLFASLGALTVVLLSWEMFALLRINGLNALKTAIFILFVVLLIPIALSFWTAAIGFVIQLRGGDALDLMRTLANDIDRDLILPRTAVVMPVFNENPVRVFAGLKATYESLEQTGFLAHFDFFILSDSTDPNVWVQEEMAFAGLREAVSDPNRLFYRNRRQNVERKPGNLADFCASWGEHYRYMIVLDADSVMTGISLINLVRLMEKNPRVGIVQAPPLPVNRRTLFGRVHQFATHAYSLIFITGLNFWQGGAANYWGHNAILRIRPFVQHCRLPRLPGKEPLGGSILSHDFVEAAFMRRAGWKVYLASELRGSYEEMPPSLVSYAARDRRWCQGNLQHSRLLFSTGFHLVNRVHLWMGVMSYVSSPLWLLLLALSTLEGIREALAKHPYFPPGQTLFPTWPISVTQQAVLLFGFVMACLLLPKCFSLVIQLRDLNRRAAFGGGKKLVRSVLAEILFSTLLAPNLALLQTRFVAGVLMGRNVQWESQDRGDAGTSFREAWRRHWAGTLLGLVWCGVLLATAPRLCVWFSPVLAGLVLSIPISVWTSRAGIGEWARHRGWFLIPEECAPPEILQRLHRELAEAGTRPWAADGDGLTRVLEDPAVCAVHLALLPPSAAKDPLQRHNLEGFELKLRLQGRDALTPQEKRQLLLDADSIRALRISSKVERNRWSSRSRQSLNRDRASLAEDAKDTASSED